MSQIEPLFFDAVREAKVWQGEGHNMKSRSLVALSKDVDDFRHLKEISWPFGMLANPPLSKASCTSNTHIRV